MNRIAFIIGDKFLYWNSIILTLAVVTAIIMFWAMAVRHREDLKAAVAAVPMCLIFSLLFARLVHWYCRPQGYSNMLAAVTDYSRGGFALIGVFAGCILTALLLRLFGGTHNLPRLLDQMSVAGALGIAVGRLAALFSTADRGILMPKWVPFPIASRFQSSVSGETEIRLAVFMFQAVIAAILFICLLCGCLKKKAPKDGDTCLTFLLWYCGTQAVLDSPRYDSLYFRSNGFVSIVQIFSVLSILLVLIIFTVRLCRAHQFKKIYLTFLTLPFLGLAGYMEYHVQRHGSQALFSYTVMSLSMLITLILIMKIRKHAVPKVQEGFHAARDFYERNAYMENPGSQPAFDSRPAGAFRQAAGSAQRPAAKRSSRHYQGKFSSPRN